MGFSSVAWCWVFFSFSLFLGAAVVAPQGQLVHINQDVGCFLINTTSFFLWCLKVWTEDVVTLALHWEISQCFYILPFMLCGKTGDYVIPQGAKGVFYSRSIESMLVFNVLPKYGVIAVYQV